MRVVSAFNGGLVSAGPAVTTMTHPPDLRRRSIGRCTICCRARRLAYRRKMRHQVNGLAETFVPELELLGRREPQVNEPVEGRMWPTFLRASPSLADAAGVYVDRAGVLPMPWVLANCLLSHKALTPGPIDRDQRIGMLPKL